MRDVLLRTLESDVTRQRWGAAYALSLLGDAPPVTLPTLLEALGSDDGDVRWAAGNILARLRGDTALVDALQQLLGTGNPAQRKMAAYCLRDLDARSPAVERALLAALGRSRYQRARRCDLVHRAAGHRSGHGGAGV